MPIILTNDPSIIEFLDQFLDEDLDFSDEKYDDYWCINIKPFKCQGCGTYICYVQCGDHLIIIWPNRDDESILEIARYLKQETEYEPRIVQYNRIIGPCITYEQAILRGMIEDITHGA